MKMFGTVIGVGMAVSFIIILVIQPLVFILRLAFNLPKLMKTTGEIADGINWGQLLEFGLLLYMILNGYWMAIVVLWVLNHWDR